MKEFVQKHKQYLLSGVSFAIPFIACGGILIALAIGFAPMGASGPDFTIHEGYNQLQTIKITVLKHILNIGSASFALMLPVLAGYISYAMAGKPGLVAGFIGGYLAKESGAGFLGALLAGILAGHVVNWIKKLPVHKLLKPIMPILIIPILSSLVIGTVMLFVGSPIAGMMEGMQKWLEGMQGSSAILLGLILGAMIAFDMGGPVNKAAFFFGASMLEQGNYHIMGAVAAAICTPPLGMGLATFIQKKLWTQEQRESGIASFSMGMIGITEGAIPFAAAEPLRVIPCIMLGSMTASAIAMVYNVGNHAPHGGPIVLLVIDNRISYIFAIAVGTVVTALSINLVKSLSQSKESL
ncbi:MAG: PTS fructose transporter subunit IIC [Sedimentisphaerales bacterium]|nr:PTS fructose transporter subunit IIC [Sedimentisphaerales bacterium]MBN2844057.1 PTS fructose transporter subunit IIC [Sedimentisphaerales bacterium]